MAKKTFVDHATQTEPQILFMSVNGVNGRHNRVLFTIVGDGTLWIDNNPEVTKATGLPITSGYYASDDLVQLGESLYAVADDGQTIDVRYVIYGPKVDE